MTTTHKVTQERGPHVIDGVVQWFSATVLTAADEKSVGGCQLRHWFMYCDPARPELPPTKAQGIGSVTHDRLERHLGGELLTMTPLEMKMLHAAGDIPKSALIEAPVGELVLAEGADPVHMTCAGVPFYGHADVIIPRRSVNEVEVLDWKTTKSIAKWAKRADELLTNVQMVSYGEWAARRFGARRVRLTHVYGQTEGAVKAERRSTIGERDEIASGWEYVQTVGRRVIQHAPCESPDEVPGNPEACEAYGGCPFRAKCKVGRRTMLMGIMSKMKKDKATAPETVPGTFAVGGSPEEIRSQIAALEAEAEKCRAQMEAPQVTPPDAPPSEHPLPAEAAKPKKRGPGRPKKEKPAGIESEQALAAEVVTEIDEDAGTYTVSPATATPVWPSRGVEVYIDCVVTCPTESLHPYLARLCRQLCDAHGALDVRCAPSDSHIAFGRWKGYLAEAIRQDPPPAGAYTLDTRGSEVAEVAADVLRDLAPVFVRGIR